MFLDNNYNFNDYEVLFESYINTLNYVSVDTSYLSSVDFFVRKIFLDGEPLMDGTHDPNDFYTKATI